MSLSSSDYLMSKNYILSLIELEFFGFLYTSTPRLRPCLGWAQLLNSSLEARAIYKKHRFRNCRKKPLWFWSLGDFSSRCTFDRKCWSCCNFCCFRVKLTIIRYRVPGSNLTDKENAAKNLLGTLGVNGLKISRFHQRGCGKIAPVVL